MSKFQSKTPSPLQLDHGITTRIMAKKLLLQIEKDMQETNSPQSPIYNSRRNSKFLSGTCIPNSTIRRTSLNNSKKIENMEEEAILNPGEQLSEPIPDEESKRRLSEVRGLERFRRKIRSLPANTEEQFKVREERYSLPVTVLETAIPQNRVRRSTLDSIRAAIEKSPNDTIRLVNADSIERRNIGQHFKVLTVEPPVSKKRDLQTQTSLPLDKLFIQMRSTSRN